MPIHQRQLSAHRESPRLMSTSDDRRHDTNIHTFGQILRRLRLAADLTQEELAERSGVSTRLVSDIERGTVRRSRRDTVRMLADALGLDGTDRATFSAIARGKREPDSADATSIAHRDRVPAPPGELVGREREVSATTSLLMQPEIRLLTLSGPGGVGKTRLALEAARRVTAAFADGAIFVDLSPLADAGLVLPTIRRALGISSTPGTTPLEQLVEGLRDQRLLLVLDNLEHLLAVAPALGRLLEQSPELTILTTSRQTLHLRAEREYQVHPLPLPDLTEPSSLADLGRIPAVELFVRRAEAVRPAFALTDNNAGTVAEISVRLDGLPLAIELAAARMRVLSPVELLDRLEQRLPLLTGGPHDVPDRHQTLRATIDWSYELLDAAEKRLFRRLSVFAGGFTLDAAEWMSADDLPLTTLDLLASLADKHLLRAIEPSDDEASRDTTRFAMLETIREYALSRLRSAGEETTARNRHTDWCVGLAERAQPELTGSNQAYWFSLLERENDNLRTALSWTISTGAAEPALRICGSLYRFWATESLFAEGRTWSESALDLKPTSPSVARGNTLLGAGVLSYFQGDYAAAEAATTKALETFKAVNDTTGIAYCYGNLGLFADVAEDYEKAIARYSQALASFRELGDVVHTGFMLGNLGLIRYFLGEYDQAEPLLEESLEHNRARGDLDGCSIALCNLGLVALARGDLERAEQLHRDALQQRLMLTNRSHLARSLEGLALTASAKRELERAACLFAASAAIRTEIGAPLPPKDQAMNDEAIDVVRSRLGDTTFQTVWQRGERMEREELIAYALAGEPEHAQRSPSGTAGGA